MKRTEDKREFEIRSRGRAGEQYVCDYLEAHGCTIAARNYSSRYGEIDIIAENEVRIIFVEVKTRTSRSMVGGFESITEAKLKKFTRTVADYLAKHNTDKQPRIDCAQVIVNGHDNSLVKIEYIKNAVEQANGYLF